MSYAFGARRAQVIDISSCLARPDRAEYSKIQQMEAFDAVYRGLCAILYNYAPGSGHPGGSVSSGRFVQALLFNGMDYDLQNPDAPDADLISYAAGHKALGLYAMWALRNEIARIGRPELLPKDERLQFRLEDLLGFRRNPTNSTPLFKKFNCRALDGHPTPATPFLKIATGASGVGVASTVGLAIAAADVYRADAPKVHMVEGEGGLTPGRVSEAMAGAATMGLKNLLMHVDWNQASIDSNHVCREGNQPGDYVQWDPVELAYMHDWNVIIVPDGFDFVQIFNAQRMALELDNGQPTALVYRTVKGWQYGMEGRASHGAGHKLCSEGFFKSVEPLLKINHEKLPCCEPNSKRCQGSDLEVIEECYWQALQMVRRSLEEESALCAELAGCLAGARDRLHKRSRKAHPGAPKLDAIYLQSKICPEKLPSELDLKIGASITLRESLGNTLNYLNKASGGAFLGAAADLMGSTSLSNSGKGFADGFLNIKSNPDARLFAMGGICEDAISGVLSGISSYGWHIGVGSSYGAFIAALGHVSARLHGIGNHARQTLMPKDPFKTMILICAHAGLKTGEDGPTHADPQPLQIMQENFPCGIAITITPWDPQEIWPLVVTALQKRPALLVPFVTRPSEKIMDRTALKLAPVSACCTGVYALRKSDPLRERDGTIILQESGVTYAFIEEALPRLDKAGFNLDIYYVSSAELFDSLPISERENIFPVEHANEAMGITGFTLATMYRWVRSDFGRAHTMHPFMHGHYLGSGNAASVLREAGLDGESQFQQIKDYVEMRRNSRKTGLSSKLQATQVHAH